jgi:hypothetical protein
MDERWMTETSAMVILRGSAMKMSPRAFERKREPSAAKLAMLAAETTTGARPNRLPLTAISKNVWCSIWITRGSTHYTAHQAAAGVTRVKAQSSPVMHHVDSVGGFGSLALNKFS